METQSPLVWSNSRIELYTITKVGLNLSPIIHPCDTESEDTIGFYHSLDNLSVLKLGVLIVHLFNRFEYFLNGLQILCFARMFSSETLHNVLRFHCSCIFRRYI